jgi:hypothetical protein
MNNDEKTPVIMGIDPDLGGVARLVDPATASIGQEPLPLPPGLVAPRNTSSRSGGSPMSTNPKSKSATQPEVDRAVLAVRRAIGRLVRLLGDDDLAVVLDAAVGLEALGAKAVVGPLAAALPRAAGLRHRAAIIGVLIPLAAEEYSQVAEALVGALERENEPVLLVRIATDLHTLIVARRNSSRPGSRSVGAQGSGGEPATPPTEGGSR